MSKKKGPVEITFVEQSTYTLQETTALSPEEYDNLLRFGTIPERLKTYIAGFHGERIATTFFAYGSDGTCLAEQDD